MRIFITHILPHKDVLKYNISVAGCNFSWNLIEGGLFDKVYSILPPFVSGKIDVDYKDLVYSKWRERGRSWAKFAALKEQWDVFKMIPNHSKVWFYNMTPINCLLFCLLRIFKRTVQSNVIILDYTPYKRKISFANLMLWLCNKANGTITLANSPLFKCKNTVLLPGVVSLKAENLPKIEKVSKDFLISGVLREEISLISVLLQTFAKLPDCNLHITGFVVDDMMIKEYAEKFDNIIYHGKVECKEYVRLLKVVPFLLSTRNPKVPENQCNFPSKVIEALLYNRIVISTIHYKQLKGINYFEVSDDVEPLVEDIRRIVSIDSCELLKYANQSYKVKELFGVDVWKRKMEQIERLYMICKSNNNS